MGKSARDAEKSMRVFLLNSPDDENPISRDMAGGLGFDRSKRTILPPLDLLSYATYLDLKGFSVALLDTQVESLSLEQIRQKVCQFHPEAVILTVSLPSIDTDILFAKSLRSQLPSDCRVVLKTGIRHPRILEKILRDSDCAYCITGECDLTIDQILTEKTCRGTSRILNDWFYEEKEPLLEDLDQLPVLNREFLKNEKYCYPRLGFKTTTMQTSRGCPFKCSYYCPYPLVQGKKWRAMTAPRILRELETMIEEQQIRNVFFRDATFTLNKSRIRDLCRLILSSSLNIAWWCETRVDCLDKELLDLMQEAGCAGMNIGIETGDESLMADLAKQGLGLADVVSLTEYCKKIGIKLHFLLMLGLPGETKRSLFETFKLVDQMEPESIGTTTVTPYPGTQLYADAIKNNWIVNPDLNSFGGHGYNMQINPLTSDDLKFAMERIHEICRIKQTRDKSSMIRREKLYNEFFNWSEINNYGISK